MRARDRVGGGSFRANIGEFFGQLACGDELADREVRDPVVHLTGQSLGHDQLTGKDESAVVFAPWGRL